TGGWDTWGDHWRRYEALGGPFGVLGFPSGGQQPWAGGYVQQFQGGRIWWAPGIGAVETWGDIDRRFSVIGGPGSGLGFPLASHINLATRGGTYQPFQGGTIHWAPGIGAFETLGDHQRQWAEAGWEWGFYGYPVSGMYLYLGGVRQDFEHGSLLVGAAPILDAQRTGVSAGDVWATWRPGCPVGPESLTLIRLNFWGFDNSVHRGEIIVRSDLAGRVENAFAAALDARFPIRKMWRVDYYGGSDPASMADDNTSGFNCRQVTGGTGISPHSFGIAVDVDTVENPYFAGHWWPNADYVDRGNVRWGMLFAGSAMTVAFRNNGFAWGASYRDYQHFQFVG
ncbi:MAG: M15 family metallopeptidase, partial [Dermatophilaceae bacterium]